MIENVSGKVAYAVLSFGGFLGIGDDHSLPWPSLKYNVALGGYQTLVPVEKIKGAPKYAPRLSRGTRKAESALAAWMITMELFRLKHGRPGALKARLFP
jgi:hypothetical protein